MSTASHNRKDRYGFEDSEGLRALLTRLHQAGRGAWREDPEAAALMRHTAEKYAALARKHGLDPWEAATAAFEAMRNPSARRAEDPWAVITHAVRITCLAEERGQGLLCSVTRARRPQYSGFHDAERFSERENPLTDFHPIFHTTPAEETEELLPSEPSEGSTDVGSAIEDTITFFALLGWPPATAHTGIEYICTRLPEASSRASAFEALRRDFHARALLDIPGRSWLAMLRTVLGSPDPDLAQTAAGRGILLRLLIGERLRDLLADDALLAEVVLSSPSGRIRG